MKFIMNQVPYRVLQWKLDYDNIPAQDIEYAESAVIPARGRVMGQAEGRDGRTRLTLNAPGTKVDGARFSGYSAKTRVLHVRVDHSTVPEFWLELDISLDQLEQWLALGGSGGGDQEEEEDDMAQEGSESE